MRARGARGTDSSSSRRRLCREGSLIPEARGTAGRRARGCRGWKPSPRPPTQATKRRGASPRGVCNRPRRRPGQVGGGRRTHSEWAKAAGGAGFGAASAGEGVCAHTQGAREIAARRPDPAVRE